MVGSLKRKLIVVMSIILTVSLIVVWGASYLSASKLLGNSLDRESELSAINLSSEIDTFFKSKISIVQAYGQMMSPDDNRAQDLALIQRAQKENPEFETFFFSHDLTNKNVINFKGDVTDVSDRVHYQESGKGEGKIIVSEPIVSKRTGNNIVTIIYPLMRDGKQYGHIGTTLPINEVQKTVSEKVFGTSGKAFLVSKKGTYIWHPQEELILKESIADSTIPSLQTAFKDILSDKRGIAQYDANGVSTYTSYAPSSLGWGIFITAPYDELYAPVDQLSLRLIMISAVVLFLSGAFIYFFTIRLVKPIHRLNQSVNVVAQGDLTATVHVKGKDEIARLSSDFNQTVSHLKNLVQGVSLSSEQVLRFTNEVSAGLDTATNSVHRINESVQQIAKGSHAASSSSQEVSLSMTDMAVGIVKIAETSSRVSEAAQEAAQHAEQGTNVVEKAVTQMGEIGDATSKVSSAIQRLEGRSKEIGIILDTITQLTSQINLLALNASIEAARAGEHGRGFAVVAGEVKKLANQSEESAGKIAELIGEIQNDTANAVNMMNSSHKDVEDGVKLIEEVRDIFDSILSTSRDVAAHILDVSAASEQMSAGSEEVSASVEEMHAISKYSSDDASVVLASTEEQLQIMQEINDTVAELNHVVEELQHQLGKFTL
ncbi:methyl-accepting chemotaxis protein [Brevibacillus daliensis]|uniref:methyl-accepting chemotaxis protein n=1 Tax=Brevibacillus daliensis TaxID=2892995 RepID=UPI001E3BF49A|nr:methyl-accepting chemotaxis protein [Brevibacillus daliensis]